MKFAFVTKDSGWQEEGCSAPARFQRRSTRTHHISNRRSKLPLIEVRAPSDRTFFYEVHWVVTRRCTYACQYCPAHRHNPRAFEADANVLVDGVTRLASLLPSHDVRLNFSGGEPTRHKAFPALVEAALAYRCIRRCRVLSNLSMPLDVYRRLAGLGARFPERLQFVASFHFAHAKPAAFVSRVSLLLESGVDVLVKLVLGAVVPLSVVELIEDLRLLRARHRKLVIRPQRVRGTESEYVDQVERMTSDTPTDWGDSRAVTYLDREILVHEVREEFDAVIAGGRNLFYGYSCDAGIGALFVNNDGSVHSALCRPEAKPLFNLYDPLSDASLPTTGVICPHERCECSASIRIPKRVV